MEISISEATILFLSGILLFSILSLVHFASTYNRHNRSLAGLSTVLVGAAPIYHISSSTGHGLMASVEYALVIAIIGIMGLFPIILAIATVALFRISLLTNWSVGASS